MRKLTVLTLSLIFSLVMCNIASAVAQMEMLEVTGIFKKVADVEGVKTIFLDVSGKTASGPLDEGCIFLDEGNKEIERETFLKRYLNRYITVELEAESGVVLLCRVAVS